MDDFDIMKNITFDKDVILKIITEYELDPNDPDDAEEIFLIEMRHAKDKNGKLVRLDDNHIEKIAISRGLVRKEDAESKFCNKCNTRYKTGIFKSITEKFRHLNCK